MTERVEGLLDQLRTARHDVAEMTAALAEGELTDRALRAEVTRELTGKGIAVTPAEKAAAQDPRVIEAAKARIGQTLQRDERMADAEALRFRAQLALLEYEEQVRNPIPAAA